MGYSKRLAGIAIGVVALASVRRTRSGADQPTGREARQTELPDLLRSQGTGRVRARRRDDPFLLVPGRAPDLRGRAEAGPQLRDGLLGRCDRPAEQCVRRAAAARGCGRRVGRAGESPRDRSEDTARARLDRSAERLLPRSRQDAGQCAPRQLQQGDGATGPALSRRLRSASLLCAHLAGVGVTQGHDLRQSAQVSSPSRQALSAKSAAPGREPFHDPRLRLCTDCREGPSGRTPLRRRRAGRAARAAHAFAHLFDAGTVGGFDRVERFGDCDPARLLSRGGFLGLCPPAARAGRQGQGPDRDIGCHCGTR